MREDDSGDDSTGNAPVASTVNVMDYDHAPRVPPVDGEALAEDLGQELECGCCAGLIYKPVVVNPCEHFFCGRSVRRTTLRFTHAHARLRVP